MTYSSVWGKYRTGGSLPSELPSLLVEAGHPELSGAEFDSVRGHDVCTVRRSFLSRDRSSMVHSGSVLRWSLVMTIWASTAVLLPAQLVNSWINPQSGSWEVATNW